MLLKGYRDDALNADAFDDEGRFRTGDIGFLRPTATSRSRAG
jgi:long-subunit acyl-CoA synthetase (AMP-forming)